MSAAKPGNKLKAISLLNIAAHGLAQSADGRMHHIHSMAPSEIPVPELVVGARFLNAWRFNGLPSQIDWRESSYTSMAPSTFVFRDVIVTSSAGIIQVDDNVIYESLAHTGSYEHGYDVQDGQVILRPRQVVDRPGTHVSILAGGKSNYFHSMIEGAARLSMLQPHLLAQAETVLVTQGAVGQGFVLDHLSLPPGLKRQNTADSDAFRIERLIYPWSVNGECDFHPCVNEFFDKIAYKVKPAEAKLPRRIYIDRRGTTLRPLVNEDEVIAALQILGFVPVKTELLSAADQVRLFRNAEAIVAPHGAGLTNIGYCQRSSAVLELFMDANVKWYFRRLAAVRGLRYDCLLGQCIDPWEKGEIESHAFRWQIEPSLVVSAADYMLGTLHRGA